MKGEFFMKKTVAVLLLLVVTFGLFSCGKNEGTPKGYQNASIGSDPFYLYVPNSWTSNASSGISSAYYPVTNRVSVNAFYQAMSDVAIQVQTVRVVESLQRTMENFQIVTHPAQTTLGGYAAYYFEYTAKSSGDIMEFRTYVAECDGGFTTLSFSAKVEAFENYKETFEDIAAKFTFKVENPETLPPTGNDTFIDGWQLCSDRKYEFFFYVPNSWSVDRTSEIPTAVFSNDGTDSSNVTMMSYLLKDGPLTAEQYWEKTKAELIYDYEVLSTDKDAKLGGIPSYAVEYKMGLVDMTYRVKQVFCATSNMVYVFTYTSDKDHYNAHMNAVDEMLTMFEFR